MADTPMVVVYPRGQLTTDDKALLREGGIIAIEADDPKQVQQLHLAAPLVNTAINGDGIVRAALQALVNHGPNDTNEMTRASHRFVAYLAASLAKENGNG